jgi:hypothetical protein
MATGGDDNDDNDNDYYDDNDNNYNHCNSCKGLRAIFNKRAAKSSNTILQSRKETVRLRMERENSWVD